MVRLRHKMSDFSADENVSFLSHHGSGTREIFASPRGSRLQLLEAPPVEGCAVVRFRGRRSVCQQTWRTISLNFLRCGILLIDG